MPNRGSETAVVAHQAVLITFSTDLAESDLGMFGELISS